jgi:UDP-N-acetylmuramate--alanine ligase
MLRVHFIGIGGIGVSALARAFLHRGYKVSGSDAAPSELLDELRREGIKIFASHSARNITPACGLVIYSLAVRKENPELKRAISLGVPTQSYPEALGEFARDYYTIAISGSHGKSTTTALVSLMAIAAGMDPTVIIGTKLREFRGKNFRSGKSDFLIIEADEWQRAFLNYRPDIAAITNTDAEHLDTYKNFADVRKTFARYAAQVSHAGALILNKRDKSSKALARAASAPVVYFSLPRKRWVLRVSGIHNQLNAEAAWMIGKTLGVSRTVAARAFGSYQGAWRRMERLPIRGMTAYSDYAHHPTEIKATIQAMKERYPKKKLLIIYQPHQIERLTKLFKDFTHAFSGADALYLVPTYQVAGREYAGKKKTSEDLARTVSGARYFRDCAHAFRALATLPDLKSHIVVFMGAGDIDAAMRRYFKIL